MALFDRASLVQIPSGYKEGKLYNIKPFDQPFEFERGSAATRVNEDGLIEYVGIGEELVTDGGFDDASAWTTSGGASVSNGKLVLDAQNEVAQQYDLGIVAGKEYRVNFTIEGENSHLIVYLGSNSSSNVNSVYTTQTEGTYSIRLDAHTDGDFIKFNCPSTGKNFTVDDVSVRLIENDTPRIDYTNGKSLLLEPQRTNLVTYSENFNTYLTNPVDAIMTPNYGIAPDGTATSTRFQWLDSTAFSYRAYNISTEHVASVYVKGTSGETVMFGFGGNVTTGNVYTFNGDWQRITFTGSSATQIFLSNYGGSTATTFEAWGLQLEEASYATSYIPTNGQAETRLADVCEGGGDESTFNDSEGVLYAEIDTDSDTINNTIALSDGTSSNAIRLGFSTTQINYTVYVSGFQVNNTQTRTTSGFNKVAIKYKANDFALWVNGVELNVDPSGSLPADGTFNRINFDRGDNPNPFYGNVKALAYFPEALTDTELQELTTI